MNACLLSVLLRAFSPWLPAKEWSHPEWAGLPTSITVMEMIPQGHAQKSGQVILESMNLTFNTSRQWLLLCWHMPCWNYRHLSKACAVKLEKVALPKEDTCFFFFLMFVSVFDSMTICEPHGVHCPQRPKEGVCSHETGFAHSC